MNSPINITPNPYVYPSKEYDDLSDTSVKWTLTDGGSASLDSIGDILRHAVRLPDGLTFLSGASGLMELFSHHEVCFGIRPREQTTPWSELFEKRIQERTLTFSIFGFPFKMPVPLKTDRSTPDAGEVSSLLRLYSLMEKVSEVAGCDASLTIFAEDGFAPFVGLKNREEKGYYQFLSRLVESLGISSRIRLIPISEMENHPLFTSTFESNLNKNVSAQEALEPEYMTKFKGACHPISRLIDTRGVSDEILAEVYSEEGDSLISSEALGVREHIVRETRRFVASYFAYLKTRDDLGFTQEMAPGSLPLTVSPKEGRLGVFPISKSVEVLPYHGVPVVSADGTLSLEYLFDLKRTASSYRAVFLEGDVEKKPFIYELQ